MMILHFFSYSHIYLGYFSKPVASVRNEDIKVLNNSDDFDDALLDDPEDDFICSQIFDLGDAQTSTPLPRPGEPPIVVNNQFRQPHPPPVTPNSRPILAQSRPVTPLSRPIVQPPSTNSPAFQPHPLNPQFPRPPIGITTGISQPQLASPTPQSNRQQIGRAHV